MMLIRLLSGFTALVLSLAVATPTLMAAEDVTLRLEPHCAEQDRTHCPLFDVADASHVVTGKHAVGDLVDMDVVLTGGTGKSIQLVRSWLQYDPQALEARSIDLTPAIAQPMPDEQTIDRQAGQIKIGGNATPDLASDRVSIARVTFRVLRATKDTDISFINFQENGSGETAVNTSSPDGSTVALLATSPSILTVKLVDVSSASSASSVSSDTSSEPLAEQTQSASSVTAASSAFALLQVQDVRVTSRESSIFLGWQPLRSSELKGYNIYYGTVPGTYMQRRAIPSTAGSLVIRDLTPGTTYYLAVRAFNLRDQESVFSQEVSVIVGDPGSSTSPLAAGIDQTPLPRGNPIQIRGGSEINGSTGGDIVLVLALLSALIGTAFAAHRERALFTHTHVA